MKKVTSIIVFIFLISISKIFAQTNDSKRWCINLGGNIPLAIGDNFLNKGYANNIGFEVGLQYYFNKNFFVGGNYQKSTLQVKNQQLIGFFQEAQLSSGQFYAGFRHRIKNKFVIENSLTIGELDVKNYSYINNYETSGTVFGLKNNLIYCFNDQINFCFGLDFNKASYNIDLDGPYKDFYSNSWQIIPTVGIRFLFGKTMK